jgi:hypothetical protein
VSEIEAATGYAHEHVEDATIQIGFQYVVKVMKDG